jgi:hypothetical protein
MVLSPMLTKCANTDCGAPFDYREGRLVRQQPRSAGKGALTSGGPVLHVWLCSKCAESYELDFSPAAGAVFLRLKAGRPGIYAEPGQACEKVW